MYVHLCMCIYIYIYIYIYIKNKTKQNKTQLNLRYSFPNEKRRTLGLYSGPTGLKVTYFGPQAGMNFQMEGTVRSCVLVVTVSDGVTPVALPSVTLLTTI